MFQKIVVPFILQSVVLKASADNKLLNTMAIQSYSCARTFSSRLVSKKAVLQMMANIFIDLELVCLFVCLFVYFVLGNSGCVAWYFKYQWKRTK